jgi:hypothetical protein
MYIIFDTLKRLCTCVGISIISNQLNALVTDYFKNASGVDRSCSSWYIQVCCNRSHFLAFQYNLPLMFMKTSSL